MDKLPLKTCFGYLTSSISMMSLHAYKLPEHSTIARIRYRKTWLISTHAYREKSSKLTACHPGALAKIDHAHQFHDVTDAKCT